MERHRVIEIFNQILQKAGNTRDYITDEELANNYPIMGCNAKRIRFHVNHSGLIATGRVKRACVFGLEDVFGALEWKKAHAKEGC